MSSGSESERNIDLDSQAIRNFYAASFTLLRYSREAVKEWGTL